MKKKRKKRKEKLNQLVILVNAAFMMVMNIGVTTKLALIAGNALMRNLRNGGELFKEGLNDGKDTG